MGPYEDQTARANRPTRFRYYIYMGIICGGTFLAANVFRSGDILFENKPKYVPLNEYKRYNNRFTIDTEGCRIPLLNAFDSSIKKFVSYPKKMVKCENSNALLANNGSMITIQKNNLRHYKVTNKSMLVCCYQAFDRPVAIENIQSSNVDNRAKYQSCIKFDTQIKVKDEFVRVTCSTKKKSNIYQQFYLTAVPKKFVKHDDKPEMKQNNDAYNVLMLGIDSVSRMNLYRTMPKTIKYVKDYGGIELMGYNKVGDNTFPNLIPMLIGIRYTELKGTCQPYRYATFDNCPFIWEWFKQAGYYTALVEDTSVLGTFNFHRGGFAKSPTDYYIHTLIHEAEKLARRNKARQACMGDKPFYQVLLDYAIDLTTILKDHKLFGFFWEVTMSHDVLNWPMVMDDNYVAFFKKLEQSGYLNKTIVFLLSDHGIRFGPIRTTKQGRIEERLPFTYVMLPPSFKQKYPIAVKNLKENSQRLTTPFNIHATLSDLLNLNNLKNEIILEKSNRSYGEDRSISLFLPIPSNRTCKMADIDDHWCTCHEETKLPKNSSESVQAVSHLIAQINSLLKDYPQCAKLNLSEVVQVMEVKVGTPGKKEVSWREFMVVIRTKPGDAEFEASLRHDGHSWTLAGTVSRLNLYSNQSLCVDDNDMKLYCYCS